LRDFLTPKPPQKWTLVIGCGLIFCLFISHLTGIDTFPPFIDETIHIHGSEQGYNQSILANANLGRQFTMWWMMVFQAHHGSPIWMGRVATLLAVLPGVAALMGMGRLAVGNWGMTLAGLIYLFSSYHFFFGRLALADPTAASATFIAIYAAYRLSRRYRISDALMTAFFLFIAVGVKISALPYLGIPIAAALTLHPIKYNWRKQLQWALVTLGVTIVLVLAYILGLRLFNQDVFSNSVSYALTNRGGAAASTLLDVGRIFNNIRFTLDILMVYLSAPVVVVSLLSMLILLIRRRWYIPLCALAPLVVIWINQIQESRFLFAAAALLLLSLALVAGDFLRSQERFVQVVGLGLVLSWGVLQWLPFVSIAGNNPVDLPLPAADFAQYVRSDASGFGLPDVRAILKERQPTLVIGLLANCQGLRFLALNDFPMLCPNLNPNGEDIDELAALLDANHATGVYAVLEDLPFVPANTNGEVIAAIERPGGGPTLSVYDLAPDA
jgi:hypothetical protein